MAEPIVASMPYCYNYFDLFPDLGVGIPALAMTIWWLHVFRVIYNFFPRGFLYLLINVAVYYLSFVFSDYVFVSLKPYLQCVFVSRILGISRYGLPAADLAYVLSILVLNSILFGGYVNMELTVANLVAFFILPFFYWWAFQLTAFQALFTVVWAAVLTWGLVYVVDWLYDRVVPSLPCQWWWRKKVVAYKIE
jgi:hypothetical protein